MVPVANIRAALHNLYALTIEEARACTDWNALAFLN
jgi:hypothetical protein